MHDKAKIKTFIELRVNNVTYDNLIKKLGVSKPTLISWGKKYKDEIKMHAVKNILEEYTKYFLLNESSIIINAEWIDRLKKDNIPSEQKEKFIKKIHLKFEKILGKTIDSFNLQFDRKTEQLTRIEFNFSNKSTMGEKASIGKKGYKLEVDQIKVKN